MLPEDYRLLPQDERVEIEEFLLLKQLRTVDETRRRNKAQKEADEHARQVAKAKKQAPRTTGSRGRNR